MCGCICVCVWLYLCVCVWLYWCVCVCVCLCLCSGAVIRAAAHARPKVTLEEAFPPLFARLVEATHGSSRAGAHTHSLRPLPADHLQWYLYLLGQTVRRTGAALLPYREQVSTAPDLRS